MGINRSLLALEKTYYLLWTLNMSGLSVQKILDFNLTQGIAMPFQPIMVEDFAKYLKTTAKKFYEIC
jgi:hypothetical protein